VLELVEPAVRVGEAEAREAARVLRRNDGLLDVVQEELLDGDVVVADGDEAELVRRVAADVELARLDDVEDLAEAARGLRRKQTFLKIPSTRVFRNEFPENFFSAVENSGCEDQRFKNHGKRGRFERGRGA